MIWIVGEETSYIKTVQSALETVGQVPELMTEDKCVQKIQAYFEDENLMINKKLYIIASDMSVALLEKLAEVRNLTYTLNQHYAYFCLFPHHSYSVRHLYTQGIT